jgi:hypothetical protein
VRQAEADAKEKARMEEEAKARAWDASHPREVAAREKATRRAILSLNLCTALAEEHHCLQRIAQLRRDSRIGGVISLTDLYYAQTATAAWKKIERMAHQKLSAMGTTALSCGSRDKTLNFEGAVPTLDDLDLEGVDTCGDE